MSIIAISAMRNEAPYLIEWVAYHMMVGFDHFVIVSNDCEDGTDLMLDRLQAMGLVTHIPNDKKGKNSLQWRALALAQKSQAYQNAKWAMVFDVDEYVNIKIGSGHLSDVFKALEKQGEVIDAIAMQWRFFGNNDVYPIHDERLLIEQFVKAAPYPVYFPWQACLYKSLFRLSDRFEKLGVHRPKKAKNARVNWFDSRGERVKSVAFEDNFLPLFPPHGGMDMMQLNHYALRSYLGFLVKADRGLPNHHKRAVDVRYWIERNFNHCDETSILRHKEALVIRKNALLAA